jgi:two-component system phosphate regulon sensor histidine kinase PhoR
MTRTIFLNTFLVGISVLLLCAALFFGVQYRQTEDETYAALGQEALYAEHGLMLSGKAYLETLDSVNRITWIAADGTVLYDSELPLPVADQSGFDEVRAALETGSGHGSRKSESSGKPTMYYARLCEDGTVLRLSRPLSVVQYALNAVGPVLWVLVLVLLISGALSFHAAKQIMKPINAIDLESPESGKYPELTPLVEKIREQKLTIESEAAQREQMRREFSANVSHELKTPLTSISGFAELMAGGLVDEERMREFSKDIYKESQRTITLVDDIIKLSKLDEGVVEPEWEDVDLYELSANVIESLRAVAERQSITPALSGERLCVRGVYRILHEMVYNLCDNAIKYNRPGGSVALTVSKTETGVKLAVEDTGIGIPKEHQKRVFERFYRVDKSHSKEIGGTGLGLSIVKHGAQFHNAEVTLTSEIGVGTTVTLDFRI